MNAGNEGSFQS